MLRSFWNVKLYDLEIIRERTTASTALARGNKGMREEGANLEI
jgi:hypothetical protein